MGEAGCLVSQSGATSAKPSYSSSESSESSSAEEAP